MTVANPFRGQRPSVQDLASRGRPSGKDRRGSPRRPGGKSKPWWKRALQDIIVAHNGQHASKDKTISYKTQHERARLEVAEELGHSRKEIASAYCGSLWKRRVPSLPHPRIEYEGGGPANTDPREVGVPGTREIVSFGGDDH